MDGFCPTQTRFIASLLGFVAGAIVGLPPIWAATPETAPPELKQMLAEIDAAANRQDADAVMGFYSDDFTHADGLNRQSFATALSQFWQRYDDLTYRTELLSWDNDGTGAIVAETRTYITGMEAFPNRTLALEATLRSRQRYVDGQIRSQEILTEESQLTTGDDPPTLMVNLPQQVAPEGRYNFDTIVREPLETDLLIGAAVEEAIEADRYLNATPVELEALSAGGIFKLGRASKEEGDYWISGLVVRGGGITSITRRLRVER